MAAKRCSTCSINYPVQGHARCYGCGAKTDVISNTQPHADWRELAASVRQRLEEAAVVGSDIVVDGPITERNGHLFLSSWNVCRSGYSSQLDPETEIVIDDVRFVVGGYSYSRREYWILKEEV